MQRKEFGKLVAVLRREKISLITGGRWGQKQLAEATHMSERMIGKIERGNRVNLDSDTLLRLAKAFGLTTLERQEFFSVAVDIDDGAIPANENGEFTFKRVLNIFQQVQLPAYLIDPLFNIIAINSSLVTFYSLPTLLLTEKEPNVLVYTFVPDSPLRIVLRETWRNLAKQLIQQFRATSLRYRHTTAFQLLFAHLCNYPNFEEIWLMTGVGEEDIDSYLRSLSYFHAEHRSVNYTVTTTTTVTCYGDLYHSTFIPCDKETLALFSQLAQQIRVYTTQLSPWPNSELWNYVEVVE